jgi:hypothetical protein
MRRSAKRIGLGALIALFAVGMAGDAFAETKKLLGTYQDWDAFTLTTDNGQKMCYVVSLPKTMAPKGVNRGQTYLTVTHSPARKVRDEVNVIAGYTYQKSSEVTFDIGGEKKTLFTAGDAAWAYDPASDRAIVAALKKGITLTVTGKSSRGTTTHDTYSLRGFSNAYASASAACPS